MADRPVLSVPQDSTSATQSEVSFRHSQRNQRSLALTVVAHPRLERIGDVSLLIPLEAPGESVEISRLEPLFFRPRSTEGQPLDDPYLSRRRPLTLTASQDGSVLLRLGSFKGSVHVDGERLEDTKELDSSHLEGGTVLMLARRIVLYLHLEEAISPRVEDDFGLVGESPHILRVRNEILAAAQTTDPVLIRGSSGTGKEVVAQAIHKRSGRDPLVPVILAAVPSSLAAAELFGAEKGAYNGLRERRLGQFRHAEGGTLFLDELGDVPMDIQPMLFRVLEERLVRPLGTDKSIPIDVRFLTATDRHLEEAIDRGEFRPQLLFRLSGHEIYLPPLKERLQDLGRLLVHLLRLELRQDTWRLDLEATESPWLPGEMMERLMLHDWPGNVRELRNVARRLVSRAKSQGWSIKPSEMVAEVDRFFQTRPSPSPDMPPPTVSATKLPAELHCHELLSALMEAGGSVSAAARGLRIGRTSFYKQWHRCGFKTTQSLTDVELRDAFERCQGDIAAIVSDLQVPKQGLFKRLRDLGLR